MVKEDGSSSAKLTELIIYGTDAVHNLKGKPQYINDQTGITSNTKFDFKGNLITMIKSFSTIYNATIDWNLPSASPIETFESDFEYDAMNRLIRHTKPDLTIEEYSFNKAGLLETISVQIRGNSQPYDFITGINYNEKGQRTDVYFGNGSKTRYNYDEHTFRLTRLLTTRNTGADILQDLNYTYDPEGNIVQVTDNAQQIFFFHNSVIEPVGLYEYDPLYRLISARGRELANLQMPSCADFANNMPVPNNNDNALQNYRQVYEYDELGNILVMSSDNWRRPYFYEEGNNRLVKHDEEQTLPDYTWDAHGNMLTMPGLTEMKWDYEGRLIKSVKGDNPTYYRYDISGNRTRKVTVKTGGIIEERLYLKGYEVFRKYISTHIDFERQTLHINDDNKRIALVETKTIENESGIEHPVSSIRYQYDNHLGSACLELDASANIISYEEYHPFGTTSYRSGRTETEVSLKRYKYVGKERDEETGLYYYGARYYAAWIGRFVSVDPLQHKYPHYTPYQYAGNKPISFIDLDGKEEKKIEIDNGSISMKETIEKGRQGSPTFKHLLDIKGINSNNYSTILSFGDNTETTFPESALTGKITITRGNDINSQIIKLTHELTNSINYLTFYKAKTNVETMVITPRKYAEILESVELRGAVNQIVVRSELGFKYSHDSKDAERLNKIIDLYSHNNITKKDIFKFLSPSAGYSKEYIKQGKDLRENYKIKHPNIKDKRP